MIMDVLLLDVETPGCRTMDKSLPVVAVAV